MPAPLRPERIGLLGGTFDPPHAGHLAAAVACRDALTLDRLLLVVANHPWQKAPQRRISPAEDRLAMVQAAVRGIPGLEVSRMEIDRGGPSYTVDTVDALRAEAAAAGRPAPEVFLIVGADLVGSLPTWERVDRLRQLVTLVVVSRPRSPAPPDPAGWQVVHLDGGGVDVSSSEIRALLAGGGAVDGLLPDAVIRCIRRRNMYAVGR
ncbi:MAG TPA: nicotinate-nucleotide adenylyltransferase [Acidimicrobiales bacterium]|nr:nicotinate-nucleotide adenylyltransferase [Acidimicrobiales bacterium]